jgi:hypothetical protein
MPDYSQGKIYKIVCNKTGKQYFGSTTEPTLARRLSGHRKAFNQWKNNNKKYTTSFVILEEKDYYIELVELVSCISKDELSAREKYHIQNNECINKCVPCGTYIEWYEKNKEKLAEKKKVYYEENKEKLKEYSEKNKEPIKKQRQSYYEDNKEELNEKSKQYYKVNKERILLQKKEYYKKIIN